MMKEGHSLKESQRQCSINYFRKHNKPLPRDSKSGLSADLIPIDAAEHPMDSEDLSIVLNYMYEELGKSGKLPIIEKDDFMQYVRVKKVSK